MVVITSKKSEILFEKFNIYHQEGEGGVGKTFTMTINFFCIFSILCQLLKIHLFCFEQLFVELVITQDVSIQVCSFFTRGRSCKTIHDVCRQVYNWNLHIQFRRSQMKPVHRQYDQKRLHLYCHRKRCLYLIVTFTETFYNGPISSYFCFYFCPFLIKIQI